MKSGYWIPEIIQIILENTSRNKDGVYKDAVDVQGVLGIYSTGRIPYASLKK